MQLLKIRNMAFVSTNPCFSCNPCSQSVSEPCPDVDENCFDLCDIIILPTDDAAVGPCAKVGTLNLADPSHNHTTALCTSNGDSVYWEVIQYDTNIFTEVVTTPSGTMTWVTGNVVANKFTGTVVVRAICGDLGAYGTVTIGIKDLCSGTICAAPTVCDKCTGNCVDASSEISIQEGSLLGDEGNVSVTANV